MKKNKLLSGILVLALVFSFVFSSSMLTFAEEYMSVGYVSRKESIDNASKENEIKEDERIEEDSKNLLEDRIQTRAGQPGYIGWKTASTTGFTDKLYVAKTGVSGTTEVAYCYNLEKVFPGTKGADFNKISNASANDFTNLVGNARLRGEELKTKILQICYEGYPKNSKSLQSRYSLSDDEFCLITQAAVWYYTDSKNVMQRGGYYDQSTKFQKMVRKQNVQNAFNQLINTTVQLPSNYELDLYYPTSNVRVQNLLSTKFKQNTTKKHEFFLDKRKEDGQGLAEAKLQLLKGDGSLIQQWISNGSARLFEAEAGSYIFREIEAPQGYEKANDIHFTIDNTGNITSSGSKALKIEKQTTGDLADKTKKFTFKLTLTKAATTNETTVKGKIGNNEIDFTYGQETEFELSDKEALIFDKLPAGTRYVVTEVGVKDGYVPNVTVMENGVAHQKKQGTDEENLSSAEDGQTNLVGERENKVIFVNDFSDDNVPITGIIENNMPFILLIGMCGVTFGALAIAKKRKRTEA